jgi:hypothetical protein
MSIELKVGDVWKLRDRYVEIIKTTGSLTSIRVTPPRNFSVLSTRFVKELLTDATFLGEARLPKVGQVLRHRCSDKLFYISSVDRTGISISKIGFKYLYSTYRSMFELLEDLKYLCDLPEVGRQYIRGGKYVREVLEVRARDVQLKDPNSALAVPYFVRLTNFLRAYKPFSEAAKPRTVSIDQLINQGFLSPPPTETEIKPNSVFFDRQNSSVFVYAKKDGKHTLRNLSNDVVVICKSPGKIVKELELIGVMPEPGDKFHRNGRMVCVSRIEKSKVYFSDDFTRLYGRESFMPLYVLLTTYSKVGAEDPYAIAAELINAGYLTPTSRAKSEPEIQELPIAPQWGRMLRPNLKEVSGKKADCIILDYVTAEVPAGFQWITYCNKHLRDPWPTLLPQVGDVYASKFNGIEVRVVKVRRTGYTVTDGRRKWKVNPQALGINYKWVR